MRLILLRHGETLWNAEKRLQGHDNSPLSPRGIEQARAIVPRLGALSPARVVTSDLGRVRQTAEIVGHADAPFDEWLRELDMGEWTGLRKDALIAEEAELYGAWRAGRYTPAGGETWDGFVRRITSALSDWLYAGQGDLLAIVHSGVVRAACFGFLGLKPAHLLPVTPGHLTILDFEDVRDTAPPRLEAYNLGEFGPDTDVAD
ncbi:histidine phosphatase family protein [Rhodovulum sulfidophilum]|uniref:histidine phosphatase family protein n=1 Tax=Rhodovulum sulfidophilum TaxID=35806 RepID=UPI001F30C6A5|nr:histidine phosphatase family protein [Rhodovulum sulfidophilum]MCE8440442.1 histidine phosphatase family protein [Rhodovulum sulfidophilum]MCE8467793.1 histidine phosphatase family protein [Rhodovulum sulfidophilum]